MTDKYDRCQWCVSDPLYVRYHDYEWGIPLHDDNRLFEMLTLEGAQAGLSWLTILRRRDGYRRAFADFDPVKVAVYDESDFVRLMADTGIIRNRLKIRSTINNAKAVLEVQKRFGSLDAYLWKFVNNTPIINNRQSISDLPASTPLSSTMSKELKKDGFTFVGSTVCYSFMQATGMVNDHLATCHFAMRA